MADAADEEAAEGTALGELVVAPGAPGVGGGEGVERDEGLLRTARSTERGMGT